jgi:hypothetical protein
MDFSPLPIAMAEWEFLESQAQLVQQAQPESRDLMELQELMVPQVHKVFRE